MDKDHFKPWPYEKRWDLAKAIAYIGSLRKAAKSIGVPYQTCQQWTQDDHWPALLARAEDNLDKEAQGIYRHLISLAVEVQQKNLEEGNEVIDKQGKKVLRRVSAGEANIVIGTMVDKLNTARGKPSRISATAKPDLKNLKENLEKLAEPKLTLVRK